MEVGLTLLNSDLSDSATHETSSENTDVLQLVLRRAESVLLHGGHALEETNQSSGYRGLGQLNEAISLELESLAHGVLGVAELLAVLDRVTDGIGSWVVATGVLLDHLSDLKQEVK